MNQQEQEKLAKMIENQPGIKEVLIDMFVTLIESTKVLFLGDRVDRILTKSDNNRVKRFIKTTKILRTILFPFTSISYLLLNIVNIVSSILTVFFLFINTTFMFFNTVGFLRIESFNLTLDEINKEYEKCKEKE